MTDIQEHLTGGDVCVVAFASGGGDFGGDLSHFEFQRSLAHIGVAHVLLRDTTERWYQHGVQGLGKVDVVIEYLRALGHRYKTVVTVGVSSGAYGALLYGQLAPVSKVIAISPLTVLGKAAEAEFGQTRPDLIHRIQLPDDYPLTIDLKPIFDNAREVDRFSPLTGPYLHGFVSDGDGTELDKQMFERLIPEKVHGFTGASIGREFKADGEMVYSYAFGHTLTLIPGYSHAQLGRGMRDRGLFAKLFGVG